VNVLMIDDDLSLTLLVKEYAAPDGFQVTGATSGESGLQAFVKEAFSLVVLDVMLPGIDGFEVLSRLRRISSVPVLMLTSRGSIADRIHGLSGGADDYLPKPFEPGELLERMRSILRRVQPRNHRLSHLQVDDVELDEKSRLVSCGGRELDLTGAEFALLHILLSRAGKVLPREELVGQVLERGLSVNDRGIDNLASKLRKKMGPSTAGKDRIRSIRGIGYVYAPSNDVRPE
jgi:two-component system, OmpR family, response regulator CpxR